MDSKTYEAMLSCDMPFLRARASLPGYRPLYGAPVLILLSSPADDPSGALSAVVAAENLMHPGDRAGARFLLLALTHPSVRRGQRTRPWLVR